MALMKNEDKEEFMDCVNEIPDNIFHSFLMDAERTVGYYDAVKTGNRKENRELDNQIIERYTRTVFSRIKSRKLKNLYSWDKAKLLSEKITELRGIARRKGAL